MAATLFEDWRYVVLSSVKSTYEGARTASAILQLDTNVAPPEVTELTSTPEFEKNVGVGVGVGGYGFGSFKHKERVCESWTGRKGYPAIRGDLTILTTEPWDGKDGKIIEEDEFFLEEHMGDAIPDKDEL
ncbi:hypothetical protein E3N88_27654 [Mikania micrantha]|uniref:Uncharacterized protein n=1 Tax=Mikania micrantha TaxID=192012 RepID=A0A5N6MX95_9ASTR|nr:hypothetical protein E3N88_27654 [Mikania micrantha]